jgi:hypothetical protein
MKTNLFLALGLMGFANFASGCLVEARQILNTDDNKYMEASALSTIQNIHNSQELGAPIELDIVNFQDVRSNTLESGIYENKDELGSQIELKSGEFQKEPSVFLSGSLGFTNNKNIFYSPIRPIEEEVFSTSVGIIAVPKISKNLRLLLGVNQGSMRYSRFRVLNLDFKGISTGLIWEANPRTTVSFLGFGTALYSFPANKEFFSDLGIITNIRHDIPISEHMLFNITAQSELHETTGSNPSSNALSRVSHSISTSLKALLFSTLNAELEYRIKFDDYSRQRRNDTNNQVNFKLEYAISPQLQIGYSANYSFNGSSNRFSNYGAFSTGLEVSTLMPLF